MADPEGAALQAAHAGNAHRGVVGILGHDEAKGHLQVADEDGRASRGRAARGCSWDPLAGPHWGCSSLHHQQRPQLPLGTEAAGQQCTEGHGKANPSETAILLLGCTLLLDCSDDGSLQQ